MPSRRGPKLRPKALIGETPSSAVPPSGAVQMGSICVNPCCTYFESVTTKTSQGSVSARRPMVTAFNSIWLLVVTGVPPVKTRSGFL